MAENQYLSGELLAAGRPAAHPLPPTTDTTITAAAPRPDRLDRPLAVPHAPYVPPPSAHHMPLATDQAVAHPPSLLPYSRQS